jgi:hypothetical protein
VFSTNVDDGGAVVSASRKAVPSMRSHRQSPVAMTVAVRGIRSSTPISPK